LFISLLEDVNEPPNHLVQHITSLQNDTILTNVQEILTHNYYLIKWKK